MTSHLFTATLKPSSPRYALWLRIFGTGTVPIESPVSHQASLPGIPVAEVYKLAIPQLTPDVRARLVAHLCARFNVPQVEVESNLDGEHGVPILGEDVFVAADARAFL